ncbi:hypothetical protein CEXT_749941 [Caerostris extrusa]|uniref:C2H2-type domain-containing protein n=1 Tax=Caerostris extrusa TaxID=172846 RepID=A0AAV4XFJ9_CAEEX|nr:hypothetical protein CEXT_749941 [Caerostris extrusa]
MPRRLLKCPYCNYSSKWKPNLTIHVNTYHSPLTTPSLDRYCATCDVQFALYENYQASFYERIERKQSMPSTESVP